MWIILQSSVESNAGLHWFYFTLLCDWKTRAILTTNKMQTENHRNSVICVFLHFKQFACFHSEFSLANICVKVYSEWSLGLLLFGFMTLN